MRCLDESLTSHPVAVIYLDTPMSRPQRAIPVAILIRENNRILFKLFLFF